MKERYLEVKERLPHYRLCRKKSGELVLQQMECVSSGNPMRPFECEARATWIDIKTVEEGAE